MRWHPFCTGKIENKNTAQSGGVLTNKFRQYLQDKHFVVIYLYQKGGNGYSLGIKGGDRLCQL